MAKQSKSENKIRIKTKVNVVNKFKGRPPADNGLNMRIKITRKTK